MLHNFKKQTKKNIIFRLDRGWLENSERNIEPSPPQRKLSGRRFSYPHFEEHDSDLDASIGFDDSGIDVLFEAMNGQASSPARFTRQDNSGSRNDR